MRKALFVLLIAGAMLGGSLAHSGAAVAQQGAVATLPQRTPPPRTLEAYWPVFAGFSVAWLAIVGYYLTMSGRVSRVARDLDTHRDSHAS